jgi:hypothetical protein
LEVAGSIREQPRLFSEANSMFDLYAANFGAQNAVSCERAVFDGFLVGGVDNGQRLPYT